MYCGLLFYRGLLTGDKKSLHYKKVKGTSAIEGQIFEYKLCALTYIKAINDRLKFTLCCNVKGFGVFDDVVLEYRDTSGRTSHICVQLKRKERQHITKQQLLGESGDFSLIKHYESIETEKVFKSIEQDDETSGRIGECLFIMYTNADVEEGLICDKSNEVGQEVFLNTGGLMLRFSEEKHKDVYEHMKKKTLRYREFLSRYRIMYKQANEKEMDGYIIPPLQKILKFPDSDRESACQYFCDFIKGWWQIKDYSYFIQETNQKENDPLQKTSEKLRERSIAKKLDEWRSQLDNPRIKYEESAITYTKQLRESNKAVLIFAPGRSTTLTATKIRQMLNDTPHIILNVQELVLDKSDVMFAWKESFDVLVLESQSSTENLQDIFNEILIFLNECDVKKFIFISSGIGNIKQTSDLRTIFSTNLTEEYDDWKFTDLVTDTRMLFLEKNVSFQGDEIKLGNIVKNDVGMLNALGSDSISRLLENEKLSIGIPIEDTVQYYIERTLLCNKDIKTRIPVQEETKPALNNGILQEVQNISSYREKDLESETSPGLTPSTLLEVEGRVILIIDEPGKGKSTLLTHLARETRKSHPDMWVVRVNINNYTGLLNELKTKSCDENDAIKLLTEAAQVKETDSLHFERRLFDNTCSSTGNMAVLIDGVDEVSPHYTEQVVQILRLLIKTKIKKIWVTSRNSMKGFLENEFQCHSYSLMPFTEKDHKYFLVKFWK